MTLSLTKRELIGFIVAAVCLCVLVPLLNAQGSISHFTLNTWGKYLCYALLAISVDLLWGYTGLLSLGQALFFSLGGYMIGMYLMLMIGDLGVYAAADKTRICCRISWYSSGTHTSLPFGSRSTHSDLPSSWFS